LTVFIRSEQIPAHEGFIGVVFGYRDVAVRLPFWRLTIGTVRLENERQVKGFLCEGIAAHGATDTTGFGG
jgi:hypothetical protein